MSQAAPTKARSTLTGLLIILIGVTIALMSILVVNRVGGDLSETILVGGRGGRAPVPAWMAVAFMVILGLCVTAFGGFVMFVGRRAASAAANADQGGDL